MSRRPQIHGEFRQPWGRVDLGGRRCRLQVLDPATAFELEPKIVAVLGETLAFAAAAPNEITSAVWRHSVAVAPAQDILSLSRDPVNGPAMAAEAIRMLGALLCRCVVDADLDAGWVRMVFESLVMGRLEVDGALVEDAKDWSASGLRPRAKWDTMAAQVRQTYGPLWTRSPYQVRSSAKDYGVPAPKSVPIAVQWAGSLATEGRASSSREILNEWTPVQMIEEVESAAFHAETQRRAMDAARSESR